MAEKGQDEKYKLTYFDLRGRAEPIRLLFALGNIPFRDERIDGKDWPELKSKTPWGQLPLLEVEGVRVISQSMSILRFLAKKCDLYSVDDLEAAQIDEYAYAVADLQSEWFNFLFERDEVKKSKQKEALLSTHLPKYFESFSKINLSNSNPGGKFLLGDKLSFADVLLAEILDSIETELGEGVVDQYPIMRGLKDAVWSVSPLKEYINDRK